MGSRVWVGSWVGIGLKLESENLRLRATAREDTRPTSSHSLTGWGETLRLIWNLESGDWELLIRLVRTLAPPSGAGNSVRCLDVRRGDIPRQDGWLRLAGWVGRRRVLGAHGHEMGFEASRSGSGAISGRGAALGEDVGATLERLKAAGHSLPDPPASGGNYLPYRIVGNLVFLPGVISSWNGVLKFSGTVGEALSVEEGYEAAQLCALNLLANLHAAVGDLDRVRQIVSVNGYVNCVPGFSATPKVINGASDLLVAVFGDAGRHVRAAVGVAGLPLDAAVEIQMTVELHPE